MYVKLAYYIDWVRGIMLGLTRPGVPLLSCNGLMCQSGECVPQDWVCDVCSRQGHLIVVNVLLGALLGVHVRD